MISRTPPPRPNVSIPLVDAYLLEALAMTALITSNAECERAQVDRSLSSDDKAAIATRHGQLAQAVLNLTTATREARRSWRRDVDDWKTERKEEMHQDRVRIMEAKAGA